MAMEIKIQMDQKVIDKENEELYQANKETEDRITKTFLKYPEGITVNDVLELFPDTNPNSIEFILKNNYIKDDSDKYAIKEPK